MKAIVIFSALLLALPLSASSTSAPYKEVRNEAVRSKQPVVYARVADNGFGIQYRRDSTAGLNVVGLMGGLLGGPAGNLAGMVVGGTGDKFADTQPTDLSEKDADALAPFLDQNIAQHDLEAALAESFATVPTFSTLVAINALPPGAPTDVTAFHDDPALIVELYASLLTDYTGLQVTALAYELSPSALATDPKAAVEGRVYRNRIDYISPLLTPTHIKDKKEIKADVAAVKAKYKGRKLSKEEQTQMRAEIKDAAAGTTMEKYREPLMEQWSANNGARLREELQLGTKVVARLLARDLVDYSTVEIRDGVGTKDWGTSQDSTMDRQVRVYYGGPFAGSLVSQPSGHISRTCQGIAFKDTVPRAGLPKFCILM